MLFLFLFILRNVFASGAFAQNIVNPVYNPFGPAAPDYQKLMADLEADRGAFAPKGTTKAMLSESIAGEPTAFALI